MFIHGSFNPANGVVEEGIFDGIDIDWEYPGACGATCDFRAEDTENFTALLAAKALTTTLPDDTDILKLEIPCGATEQTPLVVTRQDRLAYYQSVLEPRDKLLGTTLEISQIPLKGKYTAINTDAYALAQGLVSLTPLSLDLTSRNCLDLIAQLVETEVLDKD